jgi:hypothetical protein
MSSAGNHKKTASENINQKRSLPRMSKPREVRTPISK